jgi:hypothetical protein
LMADSETSRTSSNHDNLVASANGCDGRSGSKTPSGLAESRRAASRSSCQ